MHSLIREHLEDLLADSGSVSGLTARHLAECEECRSEVAAMRRQSALLRQWRAPSEVEPRAGFYARVIERIESQGPASIWSLFFDSIFGRRIAVASLALALLMGIYLVSSEKMAQPEIASSDDPVEMLAQPVAGYLAVEDQPGVVLSGGRDQDSVLVDLVTYREQ